jgi:hypothetical protein
MSGVFYIIARVIHQTSLHKHGTKTQITPEIPQASLYKHGTAQITSDIP